MINGDPQKVGFVRDFYLLEDRRESVAIIYGDTADGLLKQREVLPPTAGESSSSLGWERIQGAAETVIKHFIRLNMTKPRWSDNRIFPFLEIAADQKRGIAMPWQDRFRPLDEVIKDICEYADMGYAIYFAPEEKKLVFDVAPGAERTKENKDTVSPVEFKMGYNNIADYRYVADFTKYKSTGILGGYGEDENRLFYTLNPEYKGLARWEVFVDLSGVQEIDELTYYGKQKMVEYLEAITVEANTLPRNYIFDKDFFLGDKVSVTIPRIGTRLGLRVTEVNEIWEHATGYRYEIRFGSELPNLFNVLKNS